MGGFVQGLCTSLILLLVSVVNIEGGEDKGRIYMVKSPNSIEMPINDEAILTCEMNIKPDKFQWRYYPLGENRASNPRVQISLAKDKVIDIPSNSTGGQKKISNLSIKSANRSVAGDYQCLAHYGALAIASVPGRITITTLENFPPQKNISVTVTAGNTVLWRCDPPVSNPAPYIIYSKNGRNHEPNLDLPTDSLILSNVNSKDSGIYKCKASNVILQEHRYSNFHLHLTVIDWSYNSPPQFIIPPKRNYTVKKGDTVFIECGAYGHPIPKITWRKSNGILPPNRTQVLPGGLKITNVTSTDDGVYICSHSNSYGSIDHQITLIYNEAPTVAQSPRSTDMHEGQDLELNCSVRGTPEPRISWFLNGKSVLSDNQIEAIGNQIYFKPLEKRHAGILQCFATNVVGTDYGSYYLNIIPKQISSTDIQDLPLHPAPHRPDKPRKYKPKKPTQKGTFQCIPPLKPSVSRVNDESVVVRWGVRQNDGLPIQFFKVQYRELGSVGGDHEYPKSISKSSKWETVDVDIPPNIMSYEVRGLKPDHQYKFRIAAVYSNNDNKLSPKSDKFTLTRGDFYLRNPLPVPKLTQTEAVNATSIRVFWEYTPSPNISVDGFFINYISASSAGDYTKVSVDGEYTNNYVLTYLEPDTVYDIKMQSFTSKSASEFTPILKQKTPRLTTEPPITTSRVPESEQASGLPEKYIFIAAGVAGIALLLSIIICLIICRKWKQKKNLDNSRDHNKPAVEELNHHIQADGSDYVVTPKSIGRANGCVLPSNRITITANPLADADNKNSNMIEMSCLSSQNNNCSIAQSSASTEESQDGSGGRNKGKHKNKEKNKRNKNIEPTISGENYV